MLQFHQKFQYLLNRTKSIWSQQERNQNFATVGAWKWKMFVTSFWWRVFEDFDVVLCHNQFLKPIYISKIMQLQITETQKRSKLSDILSCFLTLTWLREGLQPPPWLRPWISDCFTLNPNIRLLVLYSRAACIY